MDGQIRPQQTFVSFDSLLMPRPLIVRSSFRLNWVLDAPLIEEGYENSRLVYIANSSMYRCIQVPSNPTIEGRGTCKNCPLFRGSCHQKSLYRGHILANTVGMYNVAGTILDLTNYVTPGGQIQIWFCSGMVAVGLQGRIIFFVAAGVILCETHHHPRGETNGDTSINSTTILHFTY